MHEFKWNSTPVCSGILGRKLSDYAGIIKGKNTPLACNRKNILIDFNKINPQLIEFGVEDLCILLPEFGQRFFGVSIDTLEFEFINNQLQLPEIITYLGSVEGQLSSINLYSNIYREYLNIQILNTLYFDIFKKYKVYINHNKINLNDPYVKSSQFKNLTYNKYAECDEKFSHNTQSGKVQLLSCMKNEILINNKRAIVADTPNDLKSKIYFSKKFSTFFGFSSVKQESKDNFIQYCGNDLFFLDTSHETPNLQAINFNVNCFYIKDFIETEHELKIVLNSNDEIIYKNNAIHFIHKNKYSDNNFYHTRKENIPYNIGEVATYKNNKTTITQINTNRDNRIFINNKKIISAQLLRIFEHDDNKNIYLGGIYEYNYATFHPSPCLKQLFILDITNPNNTQFYLFKNIFKAEFCIRDDIKIEKISKGLKFSIEKYSSFIYTNTLSRLPYIPSIFINLLNKRFLIAEKAPLPHYSPYNCEDEEFIENYREDSNIYGSPDPRVEHNTLHSRVKNILYIDNRYYDTIYHMNEEYLISTIEDYNYEKSFSYFRIPLLSGILYYDHRKIIAGVKNLAGRGDIFRIAGNDKFMLGAAEVRNPSNEDRLIINYFFTDVTFPNPTLYILGLKETPNSISEVSTENDAIIIKFIDKSLVKYDKGKFFITNNPNNKVFIEEKTVPYDIHTVDTISTPSGELKLHTLPDRSYLEYKNKTIFTSEYMQIISKNKDNTLIIGIPSDSTCGRIHFLLDLSKQEPLIFTFKNPEICGYPKNIHYNSDLTEILLNKNAKLIYKNSNLEVISHYIIDQEKNNVENVTDKNNITYKIKIEKKAIPYYFIEN